MFSSCSEVVCLKYEHDKIRVCSPSVCFIYYVFVSLFYKRYSTGSKNTAAEKITRSNINDGHVLIGLIIIIIIMMIIIIIYFVHLVQCTFHNKTYVREHIKSKNTE